MASFQFSLNALRFEDVRQEIIRYLTEKNADVISGDSSLSGQFDYRGSNISYIIDTMAYTTMLMSYMLANQANDNFLDTTTLRKNAVSISKTLGYQPSRIKASRMEGTFTYTSATPFRADSKIEINARTIFSGADNQLNWINVEPITLTYSDKDPYTLTSSANETQPPALLTQGAFREFTVLGTGEALQTFSIPTKQIDNDNMRIYVRSTNDSDLERIEWTYAKTFFQIVADTIYFVEEDITNEGTPKMIFGNGLIGRIPTITETIIAEYLETLGPNANGETNIEIPTDLIVSKSFDISSFNIDNLSFTPLADSFGGKAYETLDEIRQNAPRFFAAAGRAVTKNDFETVILNQFSSIVDSFVVIGGDELKPGDRDYLGDAYIAGVPTTGATSNEFTANENIYLSESQEAQILQELRKIGVIATRKFFLKPTYVYIGVEPTVEVKSAKSAAERNTILQRVEDDLITYFDDELGLFRFTFRETKIRSVMDSIPGVVSSDVDLTYGFIVNKDTFYIGKPTTIYLPVRYERDITGAIVADGLGNKQTTNFIKKNTNLEEGKDGVIESYNSGTKSLLRLFNIYTDSYNNTTVTQPTFVWENKDDFWYPTLEDYAFSGSINFNGSYVVGTGGQFVRVRLNESDVTVNTTNVYLDKGGYIDINDIVGALNTKINETSSYTADATGAIINIHRNHIFSMSFPDGTDTPAEFIVGAIDQVAYTGQVDSFDATDFQHKWQMSLNDTPVAYIYLKTNGTLDSYTIPSNFLEDTVEASGDIGIIDKNVSANQLYNVITLDRVYNRSNLQPEEIAGVIYGNAAVSGKLTHPSLTRWVYNSDLYTPSVLTAYVSDNGVSKSLNFATKTWKGSGGVVYSSTVTLQESASEINDYVAKYNLFFNSTGQGEKFLAGVISYDSTAANATDQFSIEIFGSAGIDLESNGFEVSVLDQNAQLYSAYTIDEIAAGQFRFTIPMYAELSTMKIWAKHRLAAFQFNPAGIDGERFTINDSYTSTFRDGNNVAVAVEFEQVGNTLNCAWQGLDLFEVNPTAGSNILLEASIIDSTSFAVFNDLGLRSVIRLEPYRFYTETANGSIVQEDGFAVYSWGIFHGSAVAEFEYNNGEMQWVTDIDGFYDEALTDGASIRIRDFFDNYDDGINMDIITILPDNEYAIISGTQQIVGQLTDFDGSFTQTIRGAVGAVNYTLI